MPDKCVYMGTGPWPIRVGYCKTEEAWLRELKRLKVNKIPPWVSPGANATCHFYEMTDQDPIAFICCPKAKGRSVAELAGSLAHEAAHVAQYLWRHIGEEKVGDETEAYFVGGIVEFCFRHMMAKS